MSTGSLTTTDRDDTGTEERFRDGVITEGLEAEISSFTNTVQGRRVPVVGRVSMDLLSLDVAGLPREAVRAGDTVELIGATVGVDEVAAAAGTISYEILTGLGNRLQREYVETD